MISGKMRLSSVNRQKQVEKTLNSINLSTTKAEPGYNKVISQERSKEGASEATGVS